MPVKVLATGVATIVVEYSLVRDLAEYRAEVAPGRAADEIAVHRASDRFIHSAGRSGKRADRAPVFAQGSLISLRSRPHQPVRTRLSVRHA